MDNIIEDMNYFNDPRVKNAQGAWFSELDTKKMLALTYLADDPDEPGEWGDVEGWVSFDWGVCPTCEGRGTHVNPSIDCCGLTREDFDEDPDFAESYFRGDYDQPCNQCGGRRVVPELTDKKYQSRLERHWKLEAEYHAEVMSERRMGA